MPKRKSEKRPEAYKVTSAGYPVAWVNAEKVSGETEAIQMFQNRYKPYGDGRRKGTQNFKAELVTEYPEPRLQGGIHPNHIGFPVIIEEKKSDKPAASAA